MSASAFIRLLESRGLLDPQIISELDRQFGTANKKFTPESIAKFLVDNGHLTRFQATSLVTELNKTLGSSASDPTAALRGGRPIDADEVQESDSVEDLLPDDIVEEVEAVEVVEDEAEPEIVEVVAESVSVRPASSDLGMEEIVRPKVYVNPNKKNAWESFRVVGIGFILLLFLMPLAFLVYWVSQGSADQAYELAEGAYSARDYAQASKRFNDFSRSYSNDPRASKAKVLSTLSIVREESDKVADPTSSLQKAQEAFPLIASEPGLAEVRSDFTDALLKMSEKFVSRLDGAKSLEDRERLLTSFTEQLKLVNDPRFVGNEERTQNKLRIQKIEEGKARAEVDIVREKDLLVALEEMQKSNEAKDVNRTYELRRALLRKHPRLESTPRLNELLAVATGLQKELVTTNSPNPTVSTSADPVDVLAKAVLVNTKGDGDPTNTNVLPLRIKNSVVAIREGDGAMLWRQYFGVSWDGEPYKMSPAGDADVLVSLPEQKSLRRLESSSGDLVWETTFQSVINPPKVDGDDIFVTTREGDVYAIDAVTGQARWKKRLPQTTEVSVGGQAGRKIRYVVGNHSNLYALNRANGECVEVIYLGHNPGTIKIPPIWILNHLLVFENTGPDYAYLKIFRTDDDGQNITPAQQIPIMFRGHFVVDPQSEGRRFVVATNLGEVAVLDVDPTGTRDTVVRMAGNVEKEIDPKVTWPLVVGTDLYMASNRLAMYQIQVSSQKLNRSWQKYDGDQFVSRPVKGEEAIFHARVVRGNLGVRVSAINPQTGDPNWEIDLGVPVTALSSGPNGFVAVTSQGAVYSLEAKSFQSKEPIRQIENQGRNQTEMKFTLPVPLPDGRLAIFNTMKGNEILLVDPSRERSISRMVAFDVGKAVPSNEPVAVGEYLVVPLSNAQLTLIEPTTGKIVGVPFQPTIEADEVPKWLNPVLLSDNQSIVIADERRNIYRLSVGKQLRPIVQQPLDRSLKGRLTVLNETVVAVSSSNTGDLLDLFDASDLSRKESVAVEGRFAWGPFTAKGSETSVVVAHSDIEGLLAVDDKGQRLWTTPIDRETFVGAVTIVDNDCLIGTAAGEILRVSLRNGEILARKNLGEPLSVSPLILPRGMLIPTDEGSVLTVPTPTRDQ
ncbi:PQQ-binding-like beta-propeller repeat protein [Pirellulaceae bacterium SH449]